MCGFDFIFGGNYKSMFSGSTRIPEETIVRKFKNAKKLEKRIVTVENLRRLRTARCIPKR